MDVREDKDLESSFMAVYSGDYQNEKVRRKRVLLSSDYRTAFKKKSIFEVYFELN